MQTAHPKLPARIRGQRRAARTDGAGVTKRKLFRVIVMLAGVCLAFWQIPALVDRIEGIRSTTMLPFAGADTTGINELGAPAKDVRSLESRGTARTDGPKNKEPELVLFSPQGAKLSAEERRKLLEEAKRSAPHVEARKKDGADPEKKPATEDEIRAVVQRLLDD